MTDDELDDGGFEVEAECGDCEHDWYATEEDENAVGNIECPVCGSIDVMTFDGGTVWREDFHADG